MKHKAEIAALTLVAAVAGASLSGCNTTGCTENRSSIPLAGFYSATDGAKIVLDSLNIGGIGAPTDSLLLIAGESASEVYLPLRSNASNASFFIEYAYKDLKATPDTITFRYLTIPYFASEECGAMMRYRIDRVVYTRHLLDSVAVIPTDSVITNVNSENLKIFFVTD